jgi:hypothetical protein
MGWMVGGGRYVVVPKNNLGSRISGRKKKTKVRSVKKDSESAKRKEKHEKKRLLTK